MLDLLQLIMGANSKVLMVSKHHFAKSGNCKTTRNMHSTKGGERPGEKNRTDYALVQAHRLAYSHFHTPQQYIYTSIPQDKD
jgi:hypothetical protein